MNALAFMYKDSTTSFMVHIKNGTLLIKKEVKQAEAIRISSMPFTACFEIFKLLEWERLRVRLNGEHLGNLRFVDNLTLFSSAANEPEQKIDDFSEQ